MTVRKSSDQDDDLLKGILQEYDDRIKTISSFTSAMEKLIIDLLNAANIRVHSVTSRVKTKQSLIGKIDKSSEEVYKCLGDITDISGIRIITFFPDEVDTVASIIQKEFDIDYHLSVDKRALLDPDKFGYLSLHYISKLSRRRFRLAEYTPYKNYKTEIQIRTILQHTWAEIEHDLGYKTQLSVPRNIRRRFSQLAGLLELADDTFAQIRNDLVEYERNILDQIKESPHLVQIDKVSLISFFKDSEISSQIDSKIATSSGLTLDENLVEEFLAKRIPALYYLDIKTISELASNLNKHEHNIVKFATGFLTRTKKQEKIGGIIQAVSILYLIYLLLTIKSPDITTLTNELRNIGLSDSSAKEFATYFFTAYKNLQSSSNDNHIPNKQTNTR